MTGAVRRFFDQKENLGGSAQQQQASTDLQGEFALDIPGSVTEAVIVVASPGRTLEGFSVFMNEDPVTLELAPRGGTLRLHWPPGGLPLQFTFNGHLIPSSDLFV